MRAVGEGDFQHLLGRGHLQIQRQIGRILNTADVRIADMAAVFAQMCGDAIAADTRYDFRRAHRIGMLAAARVTHGRDMIDIDAKAQTGGQDLRLPGLIAGMAASSAGTSSGA